jgi:hypothetical protein
MKNAFVWDIKHQFIPHRKHVMSSLQSSGGECYVIFEDFTADYEECRLLGYKPQSVPHRKHSTSLLQTPAG